jgi:hypothetical protein
MAMPVNSGTDDAVLRAIVIHAAPPIMSPMAHDNVHVDRF